MKHCFFEYLYRDADKFREWSKLLLKDALDHVGHEFSAIRTATGEDPARLKSCGLAVALLASVEKVEAWDLKRSPNGVL